MGMLMILPILTTHYYSVSCEKTSTKGVERSNVDANQSLLLLPRRTLHDELIDI